MTSEVPAYGLWLLVVINVAVFAIFAFSFTHPRSARDWRSFGAFTAFLVALFTEMYGFPLTIYLLSGWFARRYPGLDLLSHDTGHLWETPFTFLMFVYPLIVFVVWGFAVGALYAWLHRALHGASRSG